jgi:N-acetylglutamate synthase-like GNAT family acetyltransferase
MVDMLTMHAEPVKIRRGKRTDLPALAALLKPEASALIDKVQTRHWRRLASDPGLDFYIAEHDGTILGALLVCYIRTLRKQGWQAILDVALTVTSPCGLGLALVRFAKMRARKRGCRQLIAWRGKMETNGNLAVLQQGGFRPAGDMLSCEL